MEEKIISVQCPETETTEMVQVKPEGGLKWCSRWVGRRGCAQTCLPPEQREGFKPTPEETGSEAS